MSSNPSIGLEAWEARRKAWTTPNEIYLEKQEDSDDEKYNTLKRLLKNEDQRKLIYKKLVGDGGAFRFNVGLQDVIPILVTGWQEDGLWPKGMVVQGSNSD